MKFILLKPDHTYEIVEIERDNFFDEAHRLLDCSFIEICNPFLENIRFCIDDAGKLTAKEVNLLATILYNINKRPEFFDEIVGNVLIGTDDVDEYEEHDFFGLSDIQIQNITDLLGRIKHSLSL